MASPIPFARDATRKPFRFFPFGSVCIKRPYPFRRHASKRKATKPGGRRAIAFPACLARQCGDAKESLRNAQSPISPGQHLLEPSKEEIQKAVDEKNLETREFQEHEHELRAEWEQVSGPERYDRIRKYHARRVAFFVVNGWDNYPIVLKEDGREVSEVRRHVRQQGTIS
jgi:predicted acyl esterase